MMKKLITYIGLLFLMLSTSLISSSDINVDNPNSIYRHFGNFTFPHTSLPNTYTSFDLWITRDYLSDYQKQKSYVDYEYIYTVYATSKSQYYGNVRNTFMEGFQLFINNGNYLHNEIPLNLYIQKNPTVLYEMKSNNSQPSFNISWSRSYYDARN